MVPLARLFSLAFPVEYEPAPSESIKAQARALGVDPLHLLYDRMTEGDGSPLTISRSAADVVLAAATGNGSPTGDWLELAAWALGALAVATTVFVWSARSRA